MAVICTNVLLFQVYILGKKKIFSLKVDQISLHFLMKNWKKKKRHKIYSVSTYSRLFFMHPFIIKQDSYDSWLFCFFFFFLFQVFLLLITYCKYVHVYFFFIVKVTLVTINSVCVLIYWNCFACRFFASKHTDAARKVLAHSHHPHFW